MEGLFNFIPYTTVDGIATIRDSGLINLYRRLESDGIESILFHDGQINTEQDFLAEMKKPSNWFTLIQYQGLDLGFYWLNRIEPTHAYCHFVAFKEWWGKGLTVTAGQIAMDCSLNMFPTIMGLLPSSNTFAIDYLHKVGLKEVGSIPNMLYDKASGKPVPGTILYITREMLDESLQ